VKRGTLRTMPALYPPDWVPLQEAEDGERRRQLAILHEVWRSEGEGDWLLRRLCGGHLPDPPAEALEMQFPLARAIERDLARLERSHA